MPASSTPADSIRLRADEVLEGDKRHLVVDHTALQAAVQQLHEQDTAAQRANRKQNMQLFKNDYVREFLAEFLGTFILIVFGNGAVAEVVLSKPAGGVNDFFSINIAYGLAVAFGVYIAGGVSGGHLNPAVSVAFAALKKLQWRRVPVYLAAQYLGAWFGSAIIMMVYFDALKHYEEHYNIPRELDNKTASIFASYPQEFLTWRNGLFDQIFGTMLLMMGIMALTDERNTNPHKGTVPFLVGLLIAAIGLAFGFNCGYPINPARDLGPRIFTAMAGWGTMPFSIRDYNWFWIPVVGPHVGALLGALVYKYFISNHWPRTAASSGPEPPLVIHTTHPATIITATPSYQPLRTSQSAYSQGEFR